MAREHTIYISGPMRGITGFNFPAFEEAARRFRFAGWIVRNPSTRGYGSGDFLTGTGVTKEEVQEWLRADVKDVAECGAIALLPGWEESEGSRLEAAVALACGLRFFNAASMTEMIPEGVAA